MKQEASSNVARTMTMLFLLLASSAAMLFGSFVDAGRSSMSIAAAAPSNASMAAAAAAPSEDTGKFEVIFCAQSRCGYFEHTNDPYCYCCPDQSRVEYCHTTMADCRAHCAVCNPRCPT